MAVAAEAMVERRFRGPEGLGHELLERWGFWARGGNRPASLQALRERVGVVHHTLPDEALVVDRIVARIGREYPLYRRMLKRFYLGQEHPWQIAGILGYTEGFVWMSLRAVADLVARRYEEATR
jgi:hypothetical protein